MSFKVKNSINYTMALLLAYSLLGVFISSYILWFILSRGQGAHGDSHCSQYGTGIAGNFYDVFGFPRYIWLDVHSWLSIALVVLILLHIILHFNWIYEIMKRFMSYFVKKQLFIIERYIAYILLLILFIFEILSGLIIWFILPIGVENYYSMVNSIGRTFWGLQRNIWIDIHVWLAAIIISLLIIHLIMHWKWIMSVIKENKGKKQQYIVICAKTDITEH